MLVPPFTSFSVSQRGTDEKATPGATRSGLASSPPRELHHPITSGAGGVPAWGGRAKAPGYDAPTDRARSADPGNPIVESPGPSFPALIVNTTPGCEVRKAFTMESMTARPSNSFPTPKLKFSTNGMLRCSA